MISPQTTIPTAHAAIQDPRHRVSVTWPCLVTGGTMPMRVKALDWQPPVARTTGAAMGARGTHRLAGALRLGLTGLASPRGAPGPHLPVIARATTRRWTEQQPGPAPPP